MSANKEYLIDIISSVFNADRFLEGYFADLLDQSIFRECKLTLVSPNPSTKLVKITESLSGAYPNVNLIKLDSDPGISSCLNLAIKSSSAKYITIANVDDRKRQDSLFRHFVELEANEDVDLVYAASLLSTEPNETFFGNTCKSVYPCYDFDGLRGLIRHNSPHNNPMWRRSIHEKNGYFNTDLKSAADGDLWMRCVSNGSKFKMIKQVLGLYYLNPEGVSTNSRESQSRRIEEAKVKQKYIDIVNEQN